MRMFDDWATPRSPFVVAYSPRSHPNTPADFSLTSTLRLYFAIFDWRLNLSKIKVDHYYSEQTLSNICKNDCCY